MGERMGKRKKEMDALEELKGLEWRSMLSGVLFVLLGIVLVMNPRQTVKNICYAIGAVLMIVGIINLLIYFVSDYKKNMQRNKMVIGIISMVAGVFFIVLYRVVMSLFPLVMGILIFVSGLSKLQAAFNIKKMQTNGWKGMLLIAVINTLLGVFIIINPIGAASTVLRIIGVCLIFSGAVDLFNMIYTSRKVRNHIKDMKALEQDID